MAQGQCVTQQHSFNQNAFPTCSLSCAVQVRVCSQQKCHSIILKRAGGAQPHSAPILHTVGR